MKCEIRDEQHNELTRDAEEVTPLSDSTLGRSQAKMNRSERISSWDKVVADRKYDPEVTNQEMSL